MTECNRVRNGAEPNRSPSENEEKGDLSRGLDISIPARRVGERAKGARVPSYCRPSRLSVVAPPRPALSRDPATYPLVFRQPSLACRASHAVSWRPDSVRSPRRCITL